MGKSKKQKKKSRKRLRKLLKTCDPELSLLSLLILQARYTCPPYTRGKLHEYFTEHLDQLLDHADLHPECKKAWKKGKWKVIEKYLEGELEVSRCSPRPIRPKPNPEPVLPVDQGWPP